MSTESHSSFVAGPTETPTPEGLQLLPDVSVVLPCRDERMTVGICIAKARGAFDAMALLGEVIVCDNGSVDGSARESEASGARVIHEDQVGYGRAIRRGIEASDGKYILVADADDTYDLEQIPRFIEPLREGYDFVMGSRFKGHILPGAMPWLRRYLGNPLLTLAMRLLFGGRFSDTQCGIRAFTREAYISMELKTTGMEFASEMVIKTLKNGLKAMEVPIDYHPRQAKSKLHPWRDAWRHGRFMLIYSPDYLYWVPSALFSVLGLVLVLTPMVSWLITGSLLWPFHRQLIGSLLTVLAFELFLLGLSSKIYALIEGFERDAPFVRWFYAHFFSLEKALFVGGATLLLGLVAAGYPLYRSLIPGGGSMAEIEISVVGLTFAIIGAQTIFSSFFLSLIGVQHVSKEQKFERQDQ